MTDYTVSELSARSPDMAADDFDAFVEDIRANGQLVPIWVRGGEVIDGRKRLAACQRIGVEPKVINLDPAQDAEAVARALNVLRTHYTPSQRAWFASDRPMLRRGSVAAQVSKFGHQHSIGQVATEAGVSRTAVAEAKRIRQVASPEVGRAIEAGKLTLHAAEQIVDSVPRAEQAVAVEKVVEASKGKALHTPVAKILNGSDARKDRAIRYPRHQQFARAVEMMETASEIAASTVDAIATDARRKELLDSLRHIRTTLTRTINSMEAAA